MHVPQRSCRQDLPSCDHSMWLQAVTAVAQGQVQRAFANVRPPGHHASCSKLWGFCFFNNVPIAAKAIIAAGLARKVLILDWDVSSLFVYSCRSYMSYPGLLYNSMDKGSHLQSLVRLITLPLINIIVLHTLIVHECIALFFPCKTVDLQAALLPDAGPSW